MNGKGISPEKLRAKTNEATARTAATIARILSRPLMAAVAGDGAGRRGAAVAGFAAPVACATVAREGGGAATGAGAPKLMEGAVAGTAVGPPGGSVGSLIVGAAEGLGGKVIRTVSFLGWTLPVSFFGGTAPPGTLGRLSAINFVNPN